MDWYKSDPWRGPHSKREKETDRWLNDEENFEVLLVGRMSNHLTILSEVEREPYYARKLAHTQAKGDAPHLRHCYGICKFPPRSDSDPEDGTIAFQDLLEIFSGLFEFLARVHLSTEHLVHPVSRHEDACRQSEEVSFLDSQRHRCSIWTVVIQPWVLIYLTICSESKSLSFPLGLE